VFHEKRIVVNESTGRIAIAELKIWKVPKSEHYPSGIKFSLFLVSDGRTLVGIDNHKPKGPHLHLGSEECVYFYQDNKKLIEDFWDFTRKAGFEI